MCFKGILFLALKYIIFWNHGSFFFEHFPIVKFVQGEDVTVHPGYVYYYHYTVYYRNKTWIDAYHECQRNGEHLMKKTWSGHFFHFNTVARQSNWTMPATLWIGLYKEPRQDTWNDPPLCQNTVNINASGQLHTEKQCMLTYPASPERTYAVSCDMRSSYVCAKPAGSVNDTQTAYMVYNDMDVEKILPRKNEKQNTLGDCIYDMFYGCFLCYAAIYNNKNKFCKIYKTSYTGIPVAVSVTPSHINQTLVLKNASRVYFNDSTGSDQSYENNDFPCNTSVASAHTSTEGSISMTGGCTCECYSVNKSHDMILQELVARGKELSVDKSTLSSHHRQKNSASDYRKSSSTMGYVAIFILTFTAFLICIGDIMKLIMVSTNIVRKRVRVDRGDDSN